MADINGTTRSLANLEDINESLEEIRRAITTGSENLEEIRSSIATGNEIQIRIAKALEEVLHLALRQEATK
tara:strand:+ start:712 stop:924 length:213 start_codon:yes stop_codon:yes gene_type:complete